MISVASTRRSERSLHLFPLEKIYSEWPVGTDPKPHVDKLHELFESGATIVNVHSGEADQKRVIEFYGREVIPHIKLGAKAA